MQDSKLTNQNDKTRIVMIDPKELRIGNLVLRLGEVTKITSIAHSDEEEIGFVGTRSSGIVTQNQIEPIPITEEWLIKLGFENWGYKIINEYEKDLEFVLHNRVEGTSDFKACLRESNYGGQIETHFIIKIDSDIIYLAYDLKYIHQLQNCFYIFLGQELTIQLKEHGSGK